LVLRFPGHRCNGSPRAPNLVVRSTPDPKDGCLMDPFPIPCQGSRPIPRPTSLWEGPVSLQGGSLPRSPSDADTAVPPRFPISPGGEILRKVPRRRRCDPLAAAEPVRLRAFHAPRTPSRWRLLVPPAPIARRDSIAEFDPPPRPPIFENSEAKPAPETHCKRVIFNGLPVPSGFFLFEGTVGSGDSISLLYTKLPPPTATNVDNLWIHVGIRVESPLSTTTSIHNWIL